MRERRAQEIQDLQLDIETLRAMIDLALDRGAGSDDAFLRACAGVLYDKRRRLEQIESITLYVSRNARTDQPPS